LKSCLSFTVSWVSVPIGLLGSIEKISVSVVDASDAPGGPEDDLAVGPRKGRLGRSRPRNQNQRDRDEGSREYNLEGEWLVARVTLTAAMLFVIALLLTRRGGVPLIPYNLT
jgi:hypothetical protein